MELRNLAAHLTGIDSARRDAANQVGSMVSALQDGYRAFLRAHAAATTLDNGKVLKGEEAKELSELIGRLQIGRMLIAEAAFAIAILEFETTSLTKLLDSMHPDAVEGMHTKLLAMWEENALREVALVALAGKDSK